MCTDFFRLHLYGLAVLALSAALAAPLFAADPNPAAPEPHEVFAVVGSTVLTAADYRTALAAAMRQKYYHGRPPEEALAAFRRQVGEDLIERALVVNEAKRRGLKPERERIDAALKDLDRRYRDSPRWKENREKIFAAISAQLENQSLYQQLERQVKTLPEPTNAQARAYYDRHRGLFVEPEQLRLSVILLKVDPSSPKAAWQAAREEAGRIVERLKNGAEFAELARLHSGDPTAANGGDMGYVHRGMLPKPVQEVIDGLKPGSITGPVTLLEGIAVLRLEDRKPARQRGFEEVRRRAADLWRRDEGEARWKELIAHLHKTTPVRIDESIYLPPAPALGRTHKPE